MGTTLTRNDLGEAIYREVGLSRSESAKLAGEVLGEVLRRAESGEAVKLASFGTFEVVRKEARRGRNLKTGASVPIAARNVLVFRPSKGLKARINAGRRSGRRS